MEGVNDFMSTELNPKQQEMVLKNLGLAHHVVKQLGVRQKDFDEMVSVGTMGLIKAALTFDETKGKFSSYAGMCIRNEILMCFRANQTHAKYFTASIDDPVPDAYDRMDSTLGDVVPDSESDFREKIEDNDLVIKLLNIILNQYDAKRRLVLLYKLSGMNQVRIGKELNISQSYVSRTEAKASKELKKSLVSCNQRKDYKEVYKMNKLKGVYQITFSSKDVKHFNEIFARLLEKQRSFNPKFKVERKGNEIMLQAPAVQESFYFIAQIIKEIDDFSMTVDG